MPRYAKFLKEILSNKRKFEDLACVTLNEECTVIFQNKLPKKRHDSRNFTIPCVIGNLSIDDALADLGASNNAMSYSLFAKLGLGETKPTRMSIQLADRSIKYPRGIVENVLVKVNKFLFPVDFVILDMDGDVEDPLQVTLPRGNEHELSNEEVLEQFEFLLANEPSNNTDEFVVIESIGVQKLRPSLEEPPVLDLKELPHHLDYAHIDEDNRLPVTLASNLTPEDDGGLDTEIEEEEDMLPLEDSSDIEMLVSEEILVARRALSAHAKVDEAQRDNIFILDAM
ncbi:uncharacterized protein LOC125369564 [Ricinus communis]|uniref:uncharacterized protein LOC125369564 n=1 Tax=Ricinus communis TaxID=3988 RepID=UPI00201A4F9B|nr:uncharacterized protein LOC125369564 [Ricinus communis]